MPRSFVELTKDNMKTKTTAAHAAPSNDPRTSCAVALDAMTYWLIERVPDRVPPGVPPLLLAHPSWLSAVAGEYGRRLQPEITEDAKRYAGKLGELLQRLPAELLAYNPSSESLAKLRTQIDERLHAVRNPPAPQTLPAVWLELAGDLGLNLPIATHHTEHSACLSKAEDLLEMAISNIARTNIRLRPVLLELRRGVFDRPLQGWVADPRRIETRRARYVLAGSQVLPIVTDTSVFATKETELRATAEAEVTPIGRWLPSWFLDLARELGERLEQAPPAHPSYAAELAAAERAIRDRDDLPSDPFRRTEQVTREIHRVRDEFQRKASSVERAATVAWRATVEGQRARVLARIDRTLARMPIGQAWWYARILRATCAAMPDDASEIVTIVREMCVRFETTP